MMTKIGKVIQADKYLITIKKEDGKCELFFYDLKGFNKSLKVGDLCKLFYKHSILAGTISYKATKIIKNKEQYEKVLRFD